MKCQSEPREFRIQPIRTQGFSYPTNQNPGIFVSNHGEKRDFTDIQNLEILQILRKILKCTSTWPICLKFWLENSLYSLQIIALFEKYERCPNKPGFLS